MLAPEEEVNRTQDTFDVCSLKNRKIILASKIKILILKLNRNIMVEAIVLHLKQKVTGMTHPHCSLMGHIMIRD